MISQILNIFTWVFVAVIVCAAIGAILYIKKMSRTKQLVSKRRWIEQIPSILSTLGVLGTFGGITVGLYFFDTADLDESIPLLLSGLKTAFFTSIAGMLSSLYLSRLVSSLYDKTDKGVSDINVAAGLITKAVSDMSTDNIESLHTMMEQQDKQIKMFELIHQDHLNSIEILKSNKEFQNYLIAQFDQLNNSLRKAIGKSQEIVDKIDSTKTIISAQIIDLGDTAKFVSSKMNNVHEVLSRISSDTSNIASINDNVATSLEALGNLDVSEQHVSEEIDKLGGVLQTEVGELNTVVKAQFAELSAFINKVNTKIADDILQKLSLLEGKSGMVYDQLSRISCDTSNIASINDNVATSLEALGNLDASEQHVSEEIDKLGEKMGNDISIIVQKQADTDVLLTNKLNEMTQLLKKNNVEALSDYMKKFAAEFQNQMNNLINKLVADNFKELNKSIDSLNTWQQENKAQISDMIKQYREMATDFEDASSTMTDVSNTINKLVADGGKFSDLIQALNEVMLEDKNFIQVISKLKDAAEINHNNSVTLNQTANTLNGWIITQKNFVRGVERLITKLDEISKFKDYNSEFWADTKKKLQEGIDVLNQGSEQLNNQVAVIDKQFYARLNTTLANLDACIQAMYNGKI